MFSNKLKLAVFGAMAMLSAEAMATGLLNLPTAGFTVTASTNQPAGTTGWLRCNTTGNYGTGTYTAPTSGANNTCAVFPGGTDLQNTPVSSFATAVTAITSSAVTANGETLATLRERVWRNTSSPAANSQCVFGKRLVMNTGSNGMGVATFDYNPQLAGSQRLEINDVALGGFSATATVVAGYYHAIPSDSPVFRMGRAFTSVQMQSNAAGTAPATGYVHRPLNSPAPAANTEINGVGQTLSPPGSPTAAQQTAAIRTNWVDFVLDNTGGVDEDGTTAQDTSVLYVQADCPGTPTITASNASTVRIRQTGQETQPFVTILAGGQTRSGANANF